MQQYRSVSGGRQGKVLFPHRTKALIAFVAVIFGIIIVRLFNLQVLHGEEYAAIAVSQRSSKIEIPARRGEILVRDSATGGLVKLATNTTLDMIAIDPFITPDKKKVATTLAPLLFADKDYKLCLEDIAYCPQESLLYVDYERKERTENGDLITKIDKKPLPPASYEIALKAEENELYQKISHEEIDFTVLKRDLTAEKIAAIEALRLNGIGINKTDFLVYGEPNKMSQKDKEKAAEELAPLLEADEDDLARALAGGKLRYVLLKKRVAPEISEKIREIKKLSIEQHQRDKQRIFAAKSEEEPIPDYFRGVILQPEHLRYYPDNELAAQVVGFVNREGVGQYGIEGKFDSLLAGTKGVMESQNDALGVQIGLGTEKIRDAQNGASVVLTIDRIVQKKVETILAEAVEAYRADAGQVIVMEPFTGEIIAMANYPTFDPNGFGNVYLRRRTTPLDARRIGKSTPLFKKDEQGKMVEATFEEFEEEWKKKYDPEFYVYENWAGNGAYKNKTVQETFEPGSIFKPLVMAAALDAGEVIPSTKYNETGPIEVGEFLIRTSTGKYNGWQTMTNILETSSNVGMAFVAQKLGRAVMYEYLKDFGFGDYTDIDLEGEAEGRVMYHKQWSDALLLTSSFGQGLSATPLQMITAWSALANGGTLMKPHVIAEIRKNDQMVEKIQPEKVRRVISPDAAEVISSMLVSAVDNGVAGAAKVPGHKIMGKTGTAQIADIHGRGYEDATKEGAVITTFAGYAPIHKPKFVILVKFDRPRMGDNTWGTSTAAPVFRDVAAFLFEYYDIPPDEDTVE